MTIKRGDAIYYNVGERTKLSVTPLLEGKDAVLYRLEGGGMDAILVVRTDELGWHLSSRWPNYFDREGEYVGHPNGHKERRPPRSRRT